MSGSSETPAWSVVLSQTEKAGFAFVHEPIDSEQKLIALLSAAQQNKTGVLQGRPGRVPQDISVAAVVYADLAPMKTVLEHEVPDQVIQVQTGISVSELNSYLAGFNQWLPMYCPANWTINDALANGSGGALEHRFGGPRELVLGSRVVLADGQSMNCGGRVVKNVTGYDMGKLFVGSQGWLGMAVSTFLRLYAKPESSVTLRWQFDNIDDVFVAADVLNRSGLPLSCLECGSTSAFSDDNAGDSYILVAQIHGLPNVVAGISETAQKLVKGTKSGASPDCQVLDAAAEASLWGYLTEQYSCLSDDSAQLALSFSAMKPLLQHQLIKGRNIPWVCRPSTGRLMLKMPGVGVASCGALATGDRSDDTAIAPLICILREFVEQRDERITVAISDTKHNYHIHRMPQEDRALNDLQRSLKEKLDPAQILNPFVQL